MSSTNSTKEHGASPTRALDEMVRAQAQAPKEGFDASLDKLASVTLSGMSKERIQEVLRKLDDE